MDGFSDGADCTVRQQKILRFFTDFRENLERFLLCLSYISKTGAEPEHAVSISRLSRKCNQERKKFIWSKADEERDERRLAWRSSWQ